MKVTGIKRRKRISRPVSVVDADEETKITRIAKGTLGTKLKSDPARIPSGPIPCHGQVTAGTTPETLIESATSPAGNQQSFSPISEKQRM